MREARSFQVAASNCGPANRAVDSASCWRQASCENLVRAKPTIFVSGGSRFFWCKE